MIRFPAFVFAALFSGAALAADCATELKATDGYKELSAMLKCLNDRVRALEGGDRGATAQIPARPKPAAAAGTQVQELGGFKIELESCSKSGGSIACKIFVTSNGEDKYLRYDYRSRAVDENGVVLEWSGYQGAGEGQITTGEVRRFYISEVRTAAVIRFAGAQAGAADVLSALQIVLQDGSGLRLGSLTFRNVALR